MNAVILFLTRQDTDALPNVPDWLTDHEVKNWFYMVNPHLILPGTPEQVRLENDILSEVRSVQPDSSRRLGLEIDLQKRWMQLPREEFDRRHRELFASLRLTPCVLNESFQADRLPELLMKIRSVWPKNVPLGEYTLIFANQIVPRRKPGRPLGSPNKPKDEIHQNGSKNVTAVKIKRARTPAQLANDEKLRQKAAAKRAQRAGV